jgi:hypothetical protein
VIRRFSARVLAAQLEKTAVAGRVQEHIAYCIVHLVQLQFKIKAQCNSTRRAQPSTLQGPVAIWLQSFARGCSWRERAQPPGFAHMSKYRSCGSAHATATHGHTTHPNGAAHAPNFCAELPVVCCNEPGSTAVTTCRLQKCYQEQNKCSFPNHKDKSMMVAAAMHQILPPRGSCKRTVLCCGFNLTGPHIHHC